MKKLFALILVLSAFLALPIFPVFALDEIGSSEYDIETSDVMEDLSRMYIDGKKFDAAEYPLNVDSDYMLLLNLIEYAWADYGEGDDSSAYGLYFYLYNPSGDKPLARGAHLVQMSVSKSDFYVKYLLKLVSASEDYRFLKFKLENPDVVLDRLWSTTRKYKISGIEIESKAEGVKDYKIAGTFTFTGSQSAKTLKCQLDLLTTVSLQIGDTCYRTDTSSLGEYHRNQLDTVYFSIPNELLDLYEYEIYKIRWQMEQKRITGIVTNSIEGFSDQGAIQYICSYVSPSSFYDFADDEHSETIDWCFVTKEVNGVFDWTWPYTWNAPGENRRDLLSFFTYKPAVGEKMPPIDGDELLQYWDVHGFNDGSCVGIIPMQVYEIDINDRFNSTDYGSNHNFWQTMLDYGLGSAFKSWWDDTDETLFEDVKPFEEISLSKIDACDAAEFAQKYYILENDYDSIRSYVKNAEDSNATTFLFRFNVQDYFAIPGFLVRGVPNPATFQDPNSFYFEEYIYKDFDIMEIHLRDEKGIVTVLPVVMTPTTIVPDIEAPPDNPLGSGSDTDWKRIIAIIMIVLVVILVIWLITKIKPQRVKVVSSRRRRR